MDLPQNPETVNTDVPKEPESSFVLRKDGKPDGRSLRRKNPKTPAPEEPAEEKSYCKYKPEYCRAILDYFDPAVHPCTRDVEVVIQTRGGGTLTKKERQAEPMRHIGAFARSIGVHTDTIYKWAQRYPEFGEAFRDVKDMIAERIKDCGVLGVWNAQFTKLVAVNDTEMRDKTAVDVTSENRALAPTITITPREIPAMAPARGKDEQDGGGS